jgi:hypothetical protein
MNRKQVSEETVWNLWPTFCKIVRVASLRKAVARPLTALRHSILRGRYPQSTKEQQLCLRPTKAAVLQPASSADSVHSRYLECRIRTTRNALYRHAATPCTQGSSCHAHCECAAPSTRPTDWTSACAVELAWPRRATGIEKAQTGPPGCERDTDWAGLTT